MSLINEALKKAQRQRTDLLPPAAGAPMTPADGTPTARIAKRRPPMPARTLVMLLVGGGLVLVMAGVFAFVFFVMDSKPPTIAKTAPVAHLPPPTPPPPPPVAAPPVAIVALPAPSPAQPTAAVKPIEVAVAPQPASVPLPAVAAPLPAPPPVAKPAPLFKPAANPAITKFVNDLRISGVRMAGEDSKVIMNDRIVRLGDYANRATGLRLTQVTSSSVVFTDDYGVEYTKDL